jgi:uncharacterized protein (DUF362 family)
MSAARVAVSHLSTGDPAEVRAEVRRVIASVLGGDPDTMLSAAVPAGGTVVIKPNMVRHFNPAGPLSAVVTSPHVVRVLVELAADAVGAGGRVIVADSPQNDCEFDALVATAGWREVVAWARAELGERFQLLDMRPEAVRMRNGIVVERRPLPGDPAGEVAVDLGDASAFHRSGIDHRRLRGSDYDPDVTVSSHADGRHVYSLCRTFVDADLVVVVPKVKTHKKVGLSLGMKNLVGMVGDKNRLPHHTAGFPSTGGDEYPARSPWTVARQWGVERGRRLLARGQGVAVLQALRKVERAALPDIPGRSGNWWGNDTAWRMVVDLVALVRSLRKDAGRPTVFVYDGIVGGEGNGPLAPLPVDLRLVGAADDPVAGDVAITRALGLEPDDFPLLREAVARGVWGDGSRDATVERFGVPDRDGPRIELHPGWLRKPA